MRDPKTKMHNTKMLQRRRRARNVTHWKTEKKKCA
jgi:hypothetical protein